MRIVIQARQGSTRLPGKIMALLNERPMLWHVVRRLQRANPAWDVLVATTKLPADNVTAEWCRSNGIACLRGAADDVLARYVAACAGLRDDDLVLRATADNPLYCPRRTADLVAEHLRSGADYTGIVDLSYAVPEVLRVGVLREIATRTHRPYCREHVTPYLRTAEHEFRAVQLPPTWNGLRPDLRLTIDTPEDLVRLQAVFAACRGGDPVFALDDAFRYCDAKVRSLRDAA